MKIKESNNNYKKHNLRQNRNRGKLENKLETGTFFLPSAQNSGDLAVDNAWV